MGEKYDAVIQQVNDLTVEESLALANEALRRAQNGQPVTPPQELMGHLQGNINRANIQPVSNPNDISAQTIQLVRNQQGNVNRSGINLGTGYIGYDLQTPAATLVPYDTPLLNMTPRRPSKGVPVHNWKAIVDLFGGTGPQGFAGGVADGGSPNFLSRSVQAMLNTFQTISAQDSLTFQAEWRGRQLEGDMRALMSSQLLFGLKLIEEYSLINWSDYVWPPQAPLLTAQNSGGTITSASGANMYFIITAVNGNGETLGSQMVSVAVPGTTSSITLTIFTVPMPPGTKYNVYAGQGSSAPANSAMWLQGAAAQFGSASALNQPANFNIGSFTVVMTAPPATSGTAYSAVVTAGNTAKVQKDGSGNILSYQGVQSLIYKYIGANIVNGTGGLNTNIIQPASPSGKVVLADINTLFLNMYNNARAKPTHLFISPQDGLTINNLVASNGETRVVVDGSAPQVMDGQANLTAGFRVSRVLNQVAQNLVQIVPLPYLPQGTIIAGSLAFPYPVSGYNEPPFRILTNQEYYGAEYPPTMQNPMQWGMGAFVDETVVMEFLGGWGMINGIVYG